METITHPKGSFSEALSEFLDDHLAGILLFTVPVLVTSAAAALAIATKLLPTTYAYGFILASITTSTVRLLRRRKNNTH